MDFIGLLISLISGAVGGNVAGAAMKDKSLGVAGNSLAGIFGGGVGGAILQFLNMLPQTGGTFDISTLLANIGSGGVGGGIVMAIIGFIKNAMAKRA